MTIYSGAYDQKISSGPPAVSAIQVLDDRFQKAPGGTWNLSSINQANTPPVNPDCTQPGTKSTLYEYTGAWIAPEKTALYYLAVTFTFADGTRVDAATYMVLDAGCGAIAALPLPYATSSTYRSEADPSTSTAVSVAWTPPGMGVPSTSRSCAITYLLGHQHGHFVTLRFQVRRSLIFDTDGEVERAGVLTE